MENKILAHPSAHYADPLAGERYFSWQQPAGIKGAIYNLRFFAPHIGEHQDVLEFGCGGGYLLDALQCRDKIGVEVNPAARVEAARNGIQTFPTLADLPERTFDRIISSHCLEHVANPYETLGAMRCLLRTDGKLILLLPIDDWRGEPWAGPDRNAHLYTWTPRLLGNLLVSAGLKPLSIKVVNYTWPPRFDNAIWALSPKLFEMVAHAVAVVLWRRQIWAVAELG